MFTQTHRTRRPVPWGLIAVGDKVWMKWTGGPIVASATVSGFRQFEDCTPGKLRETTVAFGLYGVAAYWESLPPLFFAMTVYLGDERWLDHPLEPAHRSRGESWIPLRSQADEVAWLRPATRERTYAPRKKAQKVLRTISPSMRFQILRRDGFACTYCGARPPEVRLHVDHERPRAYGGPDSLLNLRTACDRCNVGKGALAL